MSGNATPGGVATMDKGIIIESAGDADGAIAIVEQRLLDGSPVYDIHVSSDGVTAKIAVTDFHAAVAVFRAISNAKV